MFLRTARLQLISYNDKLGLVRVSVGLVRVGFTKFRTGISMSLAGEVSPFLQWCKNCQ